MRLLVIEDEPRIAEILRDALERAEFTVDAVANCGDARAAVAVSPYDTIVLDLGTVGPKRSRPAFPRHSPKHCTSPVAGPGLVAECLFPRKIRRWRRFAKRRAKAYASVGHRR